MQAFTTLKALVVPLDRPNVDTDAIIPKQFLKTIKRTGLGVNLFDEWRYLDRGEPGQDPASRQINPDFVLNQPRYQGAQILLARENFGCGSSREHAPLGIAGLRYPRCHRPELRRYLLQQLLQERHPAHPAGRACCGAAVSAGQQPGRLSARYRSRNPDRHYPGGRAAWLRDRAASPPQPAAWPR